MAQAEGFDITGRESLYARIGRWVNPTRCRAIKNDLPMLNGRMRQLANIAKRNLFFAAASYGETHRIPVAALGKMGAGVGVAEIAEFAEGGIIGSYEFSRSAAGATPACSQGQARRMLP